MPLTTSRSRLAILAATAVLGVALPTTTAWAQTKTKDTVKAQSVTPAEPAATADEAASPAIKTSFSIDVPTIDAKDSNVSEDVLRDVLSGNLAAHADELAGLTATSITVPTITVTIDTSHGGKTNSSVVTMTNLVLSNVTKGIAAEWTLESTAIEASDSSTNVAAEFAGWSAKNFNIAAALGIYGLVKTPVASTELQTIYTDFAFSGGSMTSDRFSCTFGPITSAEFKARPLKTSFGEMMALLENIEAEPDSPSPKTLGAIVHAYADLFTAFEYAPIISKGFDCNGTDEQDRAVTISAGALEATGMRPGIYPGFTLSDFEVNVEDDGQFSFGNVTAKETDLSGPIAVVNSAPAELDEAWFEENARRLIPAFGGFSLSDIAMDIPDPETEDRIVASIGGFDLTLDKYRNGIPSAVTSHLTNLIVDLPTDTSDEQIQTLVDLGVTKVDAGFGFDVSWNEADNTIVINDISVSGANLASMALTGTIVNATEDLFGIDSTTALMAAMGLGIRDLKVDVTDAGLSDIILATAAADQGTKPETLRPIFAGLAQGTVISVLAGATNAQSVGTAINNFIAGTAKQLTLTMTAKDQTTGISFPEFAAAEADPTVLIDKVDIDASAK